MLAALTLILPLGLGGAVSPAKEISSADLDVVEKIVLVGRVRRPRR